MAGLAIKRKEMQYTTATGFEDSYLLNDREAFRARLHIRRMMPLCTVPHDPRNGTMEGTKYLMV